MTKVPQINFSDRRQRFLKKIEGGVAVLPSSKMVIRNQDVPFPPRQESNFYYLTGFEEQHSICLFASSSSTPFQMFVEPKDETKELWEGYIHGPDEAVRKFGADAAYPSNPNDYFDNAFVEAMKDANALYYRVGRDEEFDQRIFKLLEIAARKLGRTGRPLWPIMDPIDILGELRSRKDDAEISRMEMATKISGNAHVEAMKATKPGIWEYELDALLYQNFRSQGAGRLGYNSIVASGPNACVLHYTQNNRQGADGDLMLIDAGAEFDYYTADITRTYPVNGKFTKEQREVYEAVLDVQKKCVDAAKPGATIKGLQTLAIELLVDHLLKLDALKGNKDELIKAESYKEFYPHGIGHWLGMDVHDVGKYYTDTYDVHRPLSPGMILTIEPGLYFRTGPEKYQGIGVRIEDDVLITENGCQNLTAGVPKEVEEVEALCQK